MTVDQDLKQKVLDAFGLTVDELPAGMKQKWQKLSQQQKTDLLNEILGTPTLEDKLTAAKLAILTAAENIGLDLGRGN